jgi:hypothetical protein
VPGTAASTADAHPKTIKTAASTLFIEEPGFRQKQPESVSSLSAKVAKV